MNFKRVSPLFILLGVVVVAAAALWLGPGKAGSLRHLRVVRANLEGVVPVPIWEACSVDSDCDVFKGPCGQSKPVNKRYIREAKDASKKTAVSCPRYWSYGDYWLDPEMWLRKEVGDTPFCRNNRCSFPPIDNKALLDLWARGAAKGREIIVIQSLTWDPDLEPFLKEAMANSSLSDNARAAAAEKLLTNLPEQRQELRAQVLEFMGRALSPAGKYEWWRAFARPPQGANEIDPFVVKLGFEILEEAKKEGEVEQEERVRKGFNGSYYADYAARLANDLRNYLGIKFDENTPRDLFARIDKMLAWWKEHKDLPAFARAGLPRRWAGVPDLAAVMLSADESWKDRCLAEDKLREAPAAEVLGYLLSRSPLREQMPEVGEKSAYYPYSQKGGDSCFPLCRDYGYAGCRERFKGQSPERQIFYACQRLWDYHLYRLPPEEASRLLLSLWPQDASLTARQWWIINWLLEYWVPEAQEPLKKLSLDPALPKELKEGFADPFLYMLEYQRKKRAEEWTLFNRNATDYDRINAAHALLKRYKPDDRYYEAIREYAGNNSDSAWFYIMSYARPNDPLSIRLQFETLFAQKDSCVSFNDDCYHLAESLMFWLKREGYIGQDHFTGRTAKDKVDIVLSWWNENKEKFEKAGLPPGKDFNEASAQLYRSVSDDRYYDALLQFIRSTYSAKEKEKWLAVLIRVKPGDPQAVRMGFEELQAKSVSGRLEQQGVINIAAALGASLGQNFKPPVFDGDFGKNMARNALKWWQENKDKYE